MRYLDPKNDLTFKRIFGEHPNITKSFLNALLQFEGEHQIDTLEITDPNLVPETPMSKYTIVDVHCRDHRGRHFIIEMQMLWTDSFKSRVLFNACKNYVRQLPKAGKYDSLKPVYSLCLVNDSFLPEEMGFYHKYEIQHKEYPQQTMSGLQFVFIELKKFQAQNIRDLRIMILWLRFMTEIEESTQEISPELLQQQEIKEAAELLEASAYNEVERNVYEKYWDTIRTEMTLIDDALEKGEQIGLEKGEQIGLEKGKKGVVKNCYEAGLSIEMAAKLSGLSQEKVIKIYEALKQ